MRYYRRKKSETEQAFIVSDHSGPPVYSTHRGRDNLLTSKARDFPYLVAKPYTSIVVPSVEPVSALLSKEDGGLLSITAPPPELIISAISEDLWVETFRHLFEELDEFASNGATESALRYGDVLLYVTATEAKSTIIMIRRFFLTLFNAILSIYKQAKRLNLVATVEVLSDLWLEYRYGWRPLIAEIEALSKHVAHIRLDGIKSAYGNYSRTLEPSTAELNLGVVRVQHEGNEFDYKCTYTPNRIVSKVGFNYLNSDSSRNDDWLAILGLDLESLLSTAWELVPFSFIVDMFLNVGSMLQVQNSSDQVDSFNHYRTHFNEGTVNLECIGVARFEPGYRINIDRALTDHGIFFKEDTPSSVLENPVSAFAHHSYNAYGNNVPWDIMGGIPFLQYTRLNYPVPAFFPPSKWLDQLREYNGTYRGLTGINLNVPDPNYPDSDLPYLTATYVILGSVWFADWLQWVDPLRTSLDQLKSFIIYMIREDPGLSTAMGIRANLETYGQLDWNSDPVLKEYKYLGVESRFGYSSWFFGYQPGAKHVLSGELNSLSYNLPCKVVTRETDNNVKHLFTVDWDLSTGQFADLGALAVTLTSRFRK